MNLRATSDPAREPAPHVAAGERERGRPLEPETRAYMEPRFGQDFAKVRVHTDAPAAESARAIGALAYTVGDDVVMPPEHYRPDTAEGRHLLAHELAHVVQQQGATPSLQTKAGDPGAMQVGSRHTAAEHEADRAALAVSAGRSARIEQRVSAATIQRSVGGSLMGAIAGAGIGAVGLGMLLGPWGMIGGAILGGLAGLIKGGAASADSRRLTSDEQTQAQRVYGTSLDYSRVRVAVSRVMTFPSHARAPGETIYLPPDTIPAPEDLEDDLIREGYYALLVHELCHVWQTQHGIGVTRKTLSAFGGKYTYGGRKGLREAWAKGKHFLDFGLEQQASICGDYWERLDQGKDTSAYLPYITEVRQGGRRLPPALAPASEPGDFPAPTAEEPIA